LIRTGDKIKSILTEIRSTRERRDAVIRQLYYDQNLRNIIRSMVIKKGGTANDFDEVFDTALMQFIKTVSKNRDMKISSTINNYIIGIAKYVWYNELAQRTKNKAEPIDQFFDIASDSTPEELVFKHDQQGVIEELLGQIGKNCKEVLMYWANGYKMTEIADLLGYKSDGMAKKKKHICMKELLAFLDDNPHIKSVLK